MTAKRKFLFIGAGIVVVGALVALSVAKRRQPTVQVRLEKVAKRDAKFRDVQRRVAEIKQRIGSGAADGGPGGGTPLPN